MKSSNINIKMFSFKTYIIQKYSLFYSGKHSNKLNYMFLNEIVKQKH